MEIKKIPPYKRKPYVTMEKCMHKDIPDLECRRVMIHSAMTYRRHAAVQEGITFGEPVNIIPDAMMLFVELKLYNGKDWYTYS